MVKTIAHIFLEIESEIRDTQESFLVLEGILKRAEIEVDPQENPETILNNVAKTLTKEGFEYEDHDDYSLNDYLNARKLTCGEYCVLYSSIAELFDLPVSIVLAPRHSFVRWHGNQNQFNWETTVLGDKKRTNEDYILSKMIHKDAIRIGAYLQNLTRTQACALAYNNRGWIRDIAKDFERARDDFSRAIQVHPVYAKAFLNRGYVLDEMGETMRAIEDYTKVIHLDPNHAIAYKNRALARQLMGDSDGAAKDFEKSNRIKEMGY